MCNSCRNDLYMDCALVNLMVSLSLNGSLAGLVAITAGCDNVDNIGAMIIGAVAGLLLCIFVPFIDNVLKVDDPVGACSVHGVCGCFGTLAVGLFDYTDGLFYGGGVHHLLIQLLGVVCSGRMGNCMCLFSSQF